MDDERSKVEGQRTESPAQPDQNAEDELRTSIEKALHSEYIEGNNLLQRSYAPDALRLRNVFSDIRTNHSNDRELMRDAAEQSPLLKRRNDILNARLDKDQLVQLTELNNKLRADPKLLETLRNALYTLQYQRLDALKISHGAVTNQMSHIERVVAYVEQAEDPPPLAILTAAVHDIEKVVNPSQIDQESTTKEQTLLAEHEYMSAALGSEVVASALRAAGLEQYADAAAIMVGKAILPHGEGEWPELQAAKGTLPMTYELNDEKGELFVLLGGLFIKSPRSDEIAIADESIDQSDADVKAAVSEMQVTVKAVSAADKMDGLGDKSLNKYHTGNTLETIFSRQTSYDYATSFTETLVYNMRNAPDVLGIKSNPQIEGIVHRAGLLMSILEEVQNHPALSELNIAMGDPVPDFLPPYSEALGTDVAKGLVMTAIEMRGLFKNAKQSWDIATSFAKDGLTAEQRQKSVIDRNRYATVAKEKYGQYMEKLIDDLMAIGDPYDRDPMLKRKIDHTLNTLQALYP